MDFIEIQGEAMYKHAVKVGLEGVVGKKGLFAVHRWAPSRVAEIEARGLS